MMTRQQAVTHYDAAVRAAAETFTRLGCRYTVTDKLGRTITNIPKAAARRPKKHTFKDLKITERLRQAGPGDQLLFQAPGIPLNCLQKTVTAAAHRVLGAGTYASRQQNDNTVVLTITSMPMSFAAKVDGIVRVLDQGV